MTRGNQRELARLKNEKKAATGPKESLGDKNQRMQRDADIMRQKNEAAAKKKAEEDATAAAAAAQQKPKNKPISLENPNKNPPNTSLQGDRRV